MLTMATANTAFSNMQVLLKLGNPFWFVVAGPEPSGVLTIPRHA